MSKCIFFGQLLYISIIFKRYLSLSAEGAGYDTKEGQLYIVLFLYYFFSIRPNRALKITIERLVFFHNRSIFDNRNITSLRPLLTKLSMKRNTLFCLQKH